MSRSARVWALLALALMLSRACIFRPATDFPGSHFNRGANAAWLGVEWVNQPRAPQEVQALASQLTSLQVRHALVFTSYLRSDSEFNSSYSYATQFNRAIRAAQPDLNVQAWVGLPLDNPGLFGEPLGIVDLRNPATRMKVAEFCGKLIREHGFVGIHLDPEPGYSGDSDLLRLLEEVRAAIGAEATLSIAARRIWPIFPEVEWPVTGRVGWSASYYRQVAQRVDQIAVMTYDSALPSAWLYRQWVRFQVIEASQALQGTEVDLFIGIPTSEEKTLTHRPNAENMENGLQGAIAGLNDRAADASRVAGVAIYPYWETQLDEWQTYEALWLGR